MLTLRPSVTSGWRWLPGDGVVVHAPRGHMDLWPLNVSSKGRVNLGDDAPDSFVLNFSRTESQRSTGRNACT